MPLTSTWQSGDSVSIETSLTIPTDLAAGEYRLLAAIYTPLGDYLRVPVTLSGDTTATEGFSQPFRVSTE